MNHRNQKRVSPTQTKLDRGKAGLVILASIILGGFAIQYNTPAPRAAVHVETELEKNTRLYRVASAHVEAEIAEAKRRQAAGEPDYSQGEPRIPVVRHSWDYVAPMTAEQQAYNDFRDKAELLDFNYRHRKP